MSGVTVDFGTQHNVRVIVTDRPLLEGRTVQALASETSEISPAGVRQELDKAGCYVYAQLPGMSVYTDAAGARRVQLERVVLYTPWSER